MLIGVEPLHIIFKAFPSSMTMSSPGEMTGLLPSNTEKQNE